MRSARSSSFTGGPVTVAVQPGPIPRLTRVQRGGAGGTGGGTVRVVGVPVVVTPRVGGRGRRRTRSGRGRTRAAHWPCGVVETGHGARPAAAERGEQNHGSDREAPHSMARSSVTLGLVPPAVMRHPPRPMPMTVMITLMTGRTLTVHDLRHPVRPERPLVAARRRPGSQVRAHAGHHR